MRHRNVETGRKRKAVKMQDRKRKRERREREEREKRER
jgi:hypothetical protein